MPNLEALAIKFKEYRGDRRYCRYPQHLWEEAHQLSKHHPVSVIAKALRVKPCLIKNQLLKFSNHLMFTPVEITSHSFQVSIELIDSNCRPITVRFQANHSQLLDMVKSLSCGTR